MVVVMEEGATEESVQNVINRLMDMGFDIHRSTGATHTVLGAVGAKVDFDTRDIELLDGVEEVLRITAPYKLASRHFRPEGTLVSVGPGVTIGGEEVVVMAGPCSVENAAQIDTIAGSVAASGARVLRGGAFKPRTSPYSFQGIGRQGLELLRQAAEKYNLCVVSEVMDQTQIPIMLDYVDMLQVGARNMQNYNLLRELGKVAKPILLKRGISATIEELLLSAEYIMVGGNYNIVLCERGIRTFDS
ncbi:MAG TPA: N-acetylneuraminate synthase family protein, partial [Terriglobia bacterium]|nr:N-acetylneuraminate synthase family protein [Terriglobia bacterium]